MPRSAGGVGESYLAGAIRIYKDTKVKPTRLGKGCKAEMLAFGTEAVWVSAGLDGVTTKSYAEYVMMDDAARAQTDAYLKSKEGNNDMQRVAVEFGNMLSQPVPTIDSPQARDPCRDRVLVAHTSCFMSMRHSATTRRRRCICAADDSGAEHDLYMPCGKSVLGWQRA
jgi:hypothetical protein